MTDYSKDRAWSDKYIPEICRIVGPHLLVPAEFERDAREATDLIVLHAKDMRIAARIRRHEYLDRYPDDFTFRFHRDSGATTEWEKVIRGWGDWMFYGFAAANDEPNIVRWFLINLDHFRYHCIRSKKQLVFGTTPNGDGTYFRWFRVTSFPTNPPLLVASSHPVAVRAAA